MISLPSLWFFLYTNAFLANLRKAKLYVPPWYFFSSSRCTSSIISHARSTLVPLQISRHTFRIFSHVLIMKHKVLIGDLSWLLEQFVHLLLQGRHDNFAVFRCGHRFPLLRTLIQCLCRPPLEDFRNLRNTHPNIPSFPDPTSSDPADPARL